MSRARDIADIGEDVTSLATDAELSSGLAAKVNYALPTNAQTGTTYTFVAADANKLTTASNAAAVTLTIPPQSSVTWADDTILRVVNYGAGAVTVAGGSGVTVTNTATTLAQYESAAAIRTGSDAWTLVPFGSSAKAPTSVEYLVIAGGAGGGGPNNGGAFGSGGGGAGGYRSSVIGESSGRGSSAESLFSVTAGTTYTVTVGAGGAGGASYNARGGQGSNSVFASITSSGGGAGGGGGNSGLEDGVSGGSGGGGSAWVGGGGVGASGTANQGRDGGNGVSGGGNGGGGGGASGNGVSGPTSTGGAGLSSIITGSAVTRSVGGRGGLVGNSATVGSANTGNGGGGGGGTTIPGGAGGSGVVIIRQNILSKEAVTTGSPTITTSGPFRIYTFTSSGTIGW